jgi:hypothetical protein
MASAAAARVTLHVAPEHHASTDDGHAGQTLTGQADVTVVGGRVVFRRDA